MKSKQFATAVAVIVVISLAAAQKAVPPANYKSTVTQSATPAFERTATYSAAEAEAARAQQKVLVKQLTEEKKKNDDLQARMKKSTSNQERSSLRREIGVHLGRMTILSRQLAQVRRVAYKALSRANDVANSVEMMKAYFTEKDPNFPKFAKSYWKKRNASHSTSKHSHTRGKKK